MNYNEEIEWLKNMSREEYEVYKKARYGSISEFIKFIILLGVFMFLCYIVNAQSFIRPEYETLARNAVETTINEYNYGGNIKDVGVIMIHVPSGQVVCNLSLMSNDGVLVDNPNGNLYNSYHTPLARSVLFLACVPQIPSSTIIDCGDGYFEDEDAVIIDESWPQGGYQCIDLLRAVDESSVAMMKATIACFNRNMALYSQALNNTGILFGARGCATEFAYWDSQSVIGNRSSFSLVQIAAWFNAVARKDCRIVLRLDERDSSEAIDSIMNPIGVQELRKAYCLSVAEGLSIKMCSELTSVAGFTDSTPVPDSDNNYHLFAAAYWPSDCPQYSLAVHATKRHKPAGRAFPSRICRIIIDTITQQELFKLNNIDNTYHPAEKGR